MKKKQQSSLAALMAGAGLLAGSVDDAKALPFSVSTSASVATSTLSSTFNPVASSGLDSEMLSFARFDPSLGTLTGVQFSLGGSTSSENLTFSITGGEGGSGQASMAVTFNIFGPGAGGPESVNPFSSTGGAGANCTSTAQFPNCTQTNNLGTTVPTFVPNPFVLTSMADLSSYAGTGFFDLFVELSAPAFSGTQCIANNAGQRPVCRASADAAWSGDLSVTFLSTPNAPTELPAPGTLALLGLGLAGMGVTAPRRRMRLPAKF